jgi:hypothetical protein
MGRRSGARFRVIVAAAGPGNSAVLGASLKANPTCRYKDRNEGEEEGISHGG